jgi:hypothetical protein
MSEQAINGKGKPKCPICYSTKVTAIRAMEIVKEYYNEVDFVEVEKPVKMWQCELKHKWLR